VNKSTRTRLAIAPPDAKVYSTDKSLVVMFRL
jgi:hypothetical protein